MRTVTGPTRRIVVVGAGLAGLAAALRLAGAGREVTVLERRETPGGLAGRLDVGGYSFDIGPTVLTMPGLIADAFACVGENFADWLDLHPLRPVYRCWYADGDRLDVFSDVERTAGEIAGFAGPAEAAGYRRFAAWLRALYKAEFRDFVDRNFDSAADLVRPSLARLAALGGFRRLDPAVRRFLRDPRVRRAFTFQSLYAGLAPHDALAVYAVIAYLDTVGGAYFPAGGVHAVPRALADAAAKHGVAFRYGTAVDRVEVSGGRAGAVRTAGGERIPADVVVLATDLPAAYRFLLGRPPPRIRPAPSCVVLHIGGSASRQDIAHHNVYFGRSWRGTFREVIEQGRLMSDPSLLVTNPTRTDPSLAPPGRHGYYVLAPVPNLSAALDWQVTGPRYRDELLAVLRSRGLAVDIEVERLVTPADWRAAGLTAGTPFAAAHTFGQTGPFRPGNLVRGLENVVLAGAWTTPGVGVPMVLLSGRLAAERVLGRDATIPG